MSPRTDSNASTPTCFRFIEFLRTRVIFLPFLFSHRSPMVKRDDIFSMKRIELSFFPGKLIRIYYRPLSRYWKRNAYISVLFTFKPFRLIRIEKWKWVTNRRWIVIGRFLKNYPGISSTKRFEIRISFFSPIHLFLFLGPFHPSTMSLERGNFVISGYVRQPRQTFPTLCGARVSLASSSVRSALRADIQGFRPRPRLDGLSV